MNTEAPAAMTEGQARALMARLGRAENELCASLTAPLYWVIREGDGRYRTRTGSAFFLDAGEGVFGVTASHVIEGWREDRAVTKIAAVQLGDIPLDLEDRHAIIAEHPDIDIATFRITEPEVREVGKTVLRGLQKTWPPAPPDRERGVYFAGFPGKEVQWLSRNEISFAVATGGGIASSISERDVSSLIDRDQIIPVLGEGLPPENYDFGGISGGPMLTVVEAQGGIRSWRLAGVIYQGPNTAENENEAIPGFEVIRARRADFIRPDGSLDVAHWDRLR